MNIILNSLASEKKKKKKEELMSRELLL